MLSNLTKEKTIFLKPHDKQIYSNELEDLYRRINQLKSNIYLQNQSSHVTPKRFRFNKGTLQKKKTLSNENLVSVSEKIECKNLKSYEENKRQQKQKINNQQSDDFTQLQDICNINAKDFSNKRLLISDLESTKAKNLLIDNANNCIIQISHVGLKFDYLTAKLNNLCNSFVHIKDRINGPIYITNILNCIIVIQKCQQLRIHDSKDCLIVVSCESKRPIIENCRDMVFGQVDELVENTEADGKQRWTTVDDFNWLDTDKNSIHWRSVEDEKSKKDIRTELTHFNNFSVNGIDDMMHLKAILKKLKLNLNMKK